MKLFKKCHNENVACGKGKIKGARRKANFLCFLGTIAFICIYSSIAKLIMDHEKLLTIVDVNVAQVIIN